MKYFKTSIMNTWKLMQLLRIFALSVLILFTINPISIFAQTVISGNRPNQSAYEGRIWDGIARNPLPAAHVFAIDDNNQVLAHTKSSSGRGRENGRFQLINLPPNARIRIVAFHERNRSNIAIKELTTRVGYHDIGIITTQMAQYTSDELGFFHNINTMLDRLSSTSIADSYLQAAHISNFVLTTHSYSEKENLEEAVRREYGNEYRIADWNDLKNIQGSINKLVDHLDLATTGNVFVTNNGNRFHRGGNRHFFITFHNHRKPSNYLAHDNINNYYISLGSWHNVRNRILCVKR